MSNTFNSFNNTTAPTINDYIVGYGDLSGSDWEKRWAIATLVTLFQTTLDITTLAVGSDNYLRVTGSASGVGEVTLQPDGTDANQDLILEALGTGEVIINGNIQINANFDTGGFTFDTSGGDAFLGGGILYTENGDITTGSGSILLSSGNLTLSTGTLTVSAGDINMSPTGTLNMNGGTLEADTIQVALAAQITVWSDIVMGATANNKDLTVAGIVGNKDAPALGEIPIDLLITGSTEISGRAKITGDLYVNDSIIVKDYNYVSQTRGIIADTFPAQGRGLLFAEFNEIGTCANIGDCVTLPALSEIGFNLYPYQVPAQRIIVKNNGANAADVFPNTGEDIDRGTINAAVSVPAGTALTFYGVWGGSAGHWYTV